MFSDAPSYLQYNIPLKYIKRCYNCQVFRTNNNIRKIVIKLYIKFKIAHSDMFYECWVAEQVKFGEHFIRSTYGHYDAVTLKFLPNFTTKIR